MARPGPTHLRPSLVSALLPSIICAAVVFGDVPGAGAQQEQAVTFEGYITVAQPPDRFDVNGEHVTTSPKTHYGLISPKDTAPVTLPAEPIQVGAFVKVIGPKDWKTMTTTAESVLFRDIWDQKISGMGVIEKIITPGPEPVFQADGYRIHQC